MLSSAKIGTSSWRYYSNSVANGACEYYAGEGETPGRWYGRGLGELRLEPGSGVTEQQLVSRVVSSFTFFWSWAENEA